jgi:predicted phage tail protein
MKTPSKEPRWQNCHPVQIQGAGGQQQQEVQQQPQYETEQQEPRDPVEHPDTLKSESYARVLDLICEGPIEGLVDTAGNVLVKKNEFGKGVYLDETPLQGRKGVYNFQDVKVAMTWGTQDQAAIEGFGKAEDVIFSGQKFTTKQPVVVGIENPDAERLIVAVRLPGLVRQVQGGETSGDIKGARVRFHIKVKHSINGIEQGGYALAANRIIVGKSSGPYSAATAIRLPRSNNPEDSNTWQVQLVRVTPDSNTMLLNNESTLEYITVQTRNKFRYPNSVLIGCTMNARGFQNIPSRAYRVRGLLVQVPDNYFPATRTYNRDRLTGLPVTTGLGEPVEQPWTGGFYTAWTQNPAWCFYDLLTSTRYGLGDYLPKAYVDKWTLYDIGRYCDEEVDDGKGGLEPRFALNLVMAGREEAFRVVQDMASVFRGMPYWDQGTLVVAQDRPKLPVTIFNTADVEEGVFTYSGTAKRARHTVVHVRWNDRGDFYRPKFEHVEDPAGILKYGVRVLELAAFGCTSRGQAHRLGRWVLLTELNETETVTFRTGMKAAYLRPGDIFSVLDVHRSGNQNAGRILAISGDRMTLTLDRPATLGATGNTITLARPQANLSAALVANSSQIGSIRTSQIHTMPLATASQTTATVSLLSPAPAEIDTTAVFLVTTTAVSPQQFRVLNVKEDEPGRYTVTALEYNPAKFDATEQDLLLESDPISDLDLAPGEVLRPRNVTIERLASLDPTGQPALRLVIAWTHPAEYPFVEAYRVQWRRGEDNWAELTQTSGTSAELPYTLAGVYEMRVATVSRLGAMSPWVVASFEVTNENPIELFKITGLELVGQGQETNFEGRDARFQWRLNSPTVTAQLDIVGDKKADPYFLDFEVTIWDIVSNQVVHRESAVDPFFSFTYEKNASASGGPRAQFRIEVRGRDKWLNTTDPAALVVQNPAPAAPTNLEAAAAFRNVFLTWQLPPDRDVDVIEIWEAVVNNFGNAHKVAELPLHTTAWSRGGVETGVELFYWVRARDTFGSVSARHPLGGGVSAYPGGVQATDLEDFAVTASKQWTRTVILDFDTWTNDSPAEGSIAWSQHTLYHKGVAYEIPAGSTSDGWVYWDPEAPEEYQTANTNPIDLPDGSRFFQIATNRDGSHSLAWLGIANAVIGSAHIADLAVTNAKIASMAVDKLMAGTILGKIFQLGNNGTGSVLALEILQGGTGYSSATVALTGGGGAGATATATVGGGAITALNLTNPGAGYTSAPVVEITGDGTGAMGKASVSAGVVGAWQSADFVPGSIGWAILGDGSAEFNNVTVRGTLDAATIHNNSRVVNRRNPGNRLQPVIQGMGNGASYAFGWGSSLNGTALVNFGFWDNVNGTFFNGPAVIKDFTHTGPRVRFFGNGATGGHDIHPGNRVGRVGEPTPFFWMWGLTNPDKVSLVYRVLPSTVIPDDWDLAHPWLQPVLYDRTSSRNTQSGIENITVPEFGLVEFSFVPLGGAGNSTSSTDVVYDANFTVLGFNP